MTIKDWYNRLKEVKAINKQKKREEWDKQVKAYYHPEPEDEEELKRKELAKHRDYLRRLKERHERGEI